MSEIADRDRRRADVLPATVAAVPPERIERLLEDPALAATECDTPMGAMTFEQHVDGVTSEDLVDGPELPAPDDAPLQHRVLGLLGRDPT